jgi:hypothetical protein
LNVGCAPQGAARQITASPGNQYRVRDIVNGLVRLQRTRFTRTGERAEPARMQGPKKPQALHDTAALRVFA